MSVSIGNFRRNVLKTVSPKALKAGLRYNSKKTDRTRIAAAGVALAHSVGNLVQSQTKYILGFPVSQEEKDNALYYMGEVGASLVVIAKILKIKTPTSTKKRRLVGTRTEGILQLQSLATDLLAYSNQTLFGALPTVSTKKMVKIPATGTQEEREVLVVDEVNAAGLNKAVVSNIVSVVTEMTNLYWSLCFDMTGHSPATAMEGKIMRLHADFPAIQFETEKTPVAA